MDSRRAKRAATPMTNLRTPQPYAASGSGESCHHDRQAAASQQDEVRCSRAAGEHSDGAKARLQSDQGGRGCYGVREAGRNGQSSRPPTRRKERCIKHARRILELFVFSCRRTQNLWRRIGHLHRLQAGQAELGTCPHGAISPFASASQLRAQTITVRNARRFHAAGGDQLERLQQRRTDRTRPIGGPSW